MSVKIIVDSTSDLLPAIKDRVEIVPLTVNFGDEEYIDGVNIDHKMFYQKLIDSDVNPTTSQATPAAFEEKLEKITASGDSAVVITLSQKLSGTYQSAIIAADSYDDVYVVDSGSVAIGSAILVEYALRLLDEGKSAKEIAQEIERVKERVSIVAFVDTLEYLQRGGRISKTAAVVGGVLNMKPVLAVENGEILSLSKARGVKQANQLLSDEYKARGGADFTMPVLFGYTGLSHEQLDNYIESSADLWTSLETKNIMCVGSVIGTHAGPGAVAVAFFKK